MFRGGGGGNGVDHKEARGGDDVYRVLYVHLLLDVCTPSIIRRGDSQTRSQSGSNERTAG